MNNTLKDKLKGSPIYSIFQSPIARMHSMYNRMRNKRRFYLMKKQSLLVDPCTGKRQKYWIKCGVHINGNINIGYDVYFDASNAHLITIEEGAWITSRCLLLCHKRDLSKYYRGDDINKMPYTKAPIHIGRGAHIGMGTIIMPGVTVGDGAIVGAGSLVTKDVPAWSIAVGSPAKVVKSITSNKEI